MEYANANRRKGVGMGETILYQLNTEFVNNIDNEFIKVM